MPCCPVLLSLYCIFIVSSNEINGDGDHLTWQTADCRVTAAYRGCNHSALAVMRCLAGCLSVTFVSYCVEYAAIVAMECE